ncbi:hypothetical protein GCM10010394_61920 [Streptomyces crystallinus]|uniref:Uncharacterized protein n=1 Tax=Streptomyces crystallinus TaxID=68191 RepID=A0ABN1GYA8_9ACTN
MYGKPAWGTVLPLAGMAAAPEAIPGLPLAKALQATAGAGFALYCLTALVLISIRIRMRWRIHSNTTGAEQPHEHLGQK